VSICPFTISICYWTARRCIDRALEIRAVTHQAQPELEQIASAGTFMSSFDLALSIVLGVGLAAATGFRVFLPMLIVSVASYTGHLSS
jgi:Domain of unknown function (DUF4126)